MVWAKRADGTWGNVEPAPAGDTALAAAPEPARASTPPVRAVSQLAASFTAAPVPKRWGNVETAPAAKVVPAAKLEPVRASTPPPRAVSQLAASFTASAAPKRWAPVETAPTANVVPMVVPEPARASTPPRAVSQLAAAFTAPISFAPPPAVPKASVTPLAPKFKPPRPPRASAKAAPELEPEPAPEPEPENEPAEDEPPPAPAPWRRTAPAPPPVPVPPSHAPRSTSVPPATRRRAAPAPPKKELAPPPPRAVPRAPSPISRPPLPARPSLQRAVTSPSPPSTPEPEPELEYDDYQPEASTSTSSLPQPQLTSHRPPPTRSKTTSGPSSSKAGPTWSDNKSGYAKGKAIELARNRRNCLNPPPECFSRTPPPESAPGDGGIQITYAPIVPVVIRSPNSNDLARAITTGAAFKSKPPAMATHDVYRQDWDQLWEDIDETARIELRTSAGISVATLPLMPIFGAGFVVGTLVERKLRAERVKPTCKLVEVYNVQLFRPRRLDVYIAQDNIRLSGPYTYSTSRKEVDPAQIAVKEATNEQEKAKAMSEVSKWAGKFRIVVQSWPPA